MILLLLNILFLFMFVAVILFLMKQKGSANFQNIFDHYTQLGVLVTFVLVMINCIVLLDAESKLPVFALIAIFADVISPFWVPLFFYLIRKRINNIELKRYLQTVARLSFLLVVLTYSVLFTGILN